MIYQRYLLPIFCAVLISFPAFQLFGQSEDSLKPGEFQVVAEEGIRELQQRYIASKEKSNQFPGYRVQIYNGRKSDLLKRRSEFLSIFPESEAYTLYDSPEYKLQIGDFRTRLEAEKFLKEVNEQFGSGFVVRTMINPPELQ